MRGKKLLLGALFVVLALHQGATACLAAEITVSAAASLTNALGDIVKVFHEKHPDIKVVTNFAASGALLRQMEEGAPVDVFASADQETMNKAAVKNLIDPASRADFVSNSLVLIAPAGNAVALTGIKDLAKKEVERIAVGNPASVPVGRYTRDALASLGMWDALQGKLVMAESVRQALDYVSRGEVQAGFVYMTDAKVAGAKIRIVAAAGGHEPVRYPVAVVKSGGHAKEANMFIDFVRGPEGAAILDKYGFGKP